MIERRANGWEVSSETLAIRLYPQPSAAGTITIHVIAWPAANALTRAVSLTHALPCDFAPAEILLSPTRLECFARISEHVSAFRHGFRVDLPGGMARELRAAIPRVQSLARVAHALLKHVATQGVCQGIGQPTAEHVLPHLSGVVYAVLGDVLWEHHDYAAAIDTEIAVHLEPGEETTRLRAALTSKCARELVAFAQDRPGWRTPPQTGLRR